MIKCINLKKIYKEITAINDINLHIKKAECIVLKGSSGSGKSTLLALIAGLAKPTNGEVIVDEKSISKIPEHFAAQIRQDHIGFIFQQYHLIPTLSAFDNIITPLIPQNPDFKSLEKEVDKLLNLLEISDKKSTIVKNLSGGEQQRVAIARALINKPKIIIADEPTANLDSKLSLDFIEIMKKLKDDSRTIIISTHDPLFFDLDFVDRIVELKDGKCL